MVRVPRRVLARCLVRGLFLQAAWNRRGMQNLGFAFAIAPALAALYPEAPARREALRRHLGFFNCHPYLASAILGGAIHHEEKVAAGLEPPGSAVSYKATLQGPLAAIGDGFFWTALRPFIGAAAVLGAVLFGWPAVVAALTMYNAIHLAFRIGLFRAGYRQGDAVVGPVARLHLPILSDRLRAAGVALCGLSAALLGVHGGEGPRATVVVTAVAAAALGYGALAHGARLFPAAYGAIMAAVGAALVVGRLHGSP